MRGRTNHRTPEPTPEQMTVVVAAFREGDKVAFRALYDVYHAAVYRFCKRMMGDDAAAKDVFQDTFIRFYEHHRELRGDNVRSWLFVIARRSCLNALRSRRQEHDVFDEVHHGAERLAESDVALREQIEKALMTLPAAMREAIVLREFEGYSYQEIAHICNIDVSLAKVRVHRARIAMRKLLASIMIEEQR